MHKVLVALSPMPTAAVKVGFSPPFACLFIRTISQILLELEYKNVEKKFPR